MKGHKNRKMERKTTDNFVLPNQKSEIIFYRNGPFKSPKNLNKLKMSRTTDCVENEPPEIPGERVTSFSPSRRYLQLETLLGKGTFKTVYKGIDMVDKKEVAWNTIRVIHKKNETVAEILLLRRLDHPNVIKLCDSWFNPREIVFITEYMPTGTISQYLKTIKEPIPVKTIRSWCTQILKALVYLHTQNPPIIHRDIKNDNIFLDLNTDTVKIGDFGVAKSYIKVKYHLVGTPEYIAPEVYRLQNYTPKSDVYAFGLTLLHMVTQEIPYNELKTPIYVYQSVLQGILPLSIRKVNGSCLKNLIRQCLFNFNDRPTSEDCLNHHFFNDEYTNVFFLKNCIGDCNIPDVPYKSTIFSENTVTALSIFGATSCTAVFQIFFKEKDYFLKCIFDTQQDRVECIVADMVAEGVIEDSKGLEMIRLLYASLDKCRHKNDNGRIKSAIVEVLGSEYIFHGVKQLPNPYSGHISLDEDGPIFVEFLDKNGKPSKQTTDYMNEEFYYYYRECEFKNGIVKEGSLECHKMDSSKLEDVLELYKVNVSVMTKKFKRKPMTKELEFKNKVLPVNLLFKMHGCIDLDHICDEKCGHTVPLDIESSSEEEEDLEPLYVRVVRNCKFDEDMVVYVESDDSFFEAGVYGGRTTKLKVDKGERRRRSKRDKSKKECEKNESINKGNVNESDNNLENEENNLCSNCNNSCSMTSPSKEGDLVSESIANVSSENKNSDSNFENMKSPENKLRGLKSDEESDLGGRFFEDTCSVEEFSQETASLARRSTEMAFEWAKLLKTQDLDYVGDLRILCDEDWDKLGLTVFASRKMKNVLYGKDKNPLKEKQLCVNLELKEYNDSNCISVFIDEVVNFINKKSLKKYWEEKILAQDIRSVGELKDLTENDWGNMGLSVYGVRILKNCLYRKGKVYKVL